MRVKLEWINELVDLTGLSVSDIVDKISLYSIEVEEVSKLVDASNVVIGHVLTKTPHPDSDHLNVLTIDVGKETLQIVCGAPNVEKDQYVIVALVGANLPNGFTIKQSKIRGVESFGMVCSLGELGIEKKYIPELYANGIYYFNDSVEVGMDALKALNVADEVLELGLTPNRGDMLSMIGVAYELSACFNRELKPLVYEYQKALTNNEKVNVKIDTPNCFCYYAQVVRDVKIKESPRWLRSRLIAFGIRPINNCVDITNYILALFGQPLHAFDYDALGNNILVRQANKDEVIVTLDDIERKLTEDDILITDGKNGVALAGVMGGASTEIKDTTKNILIEAAVFDSSSIRKTADRLNLHSESSMRFERNVDVNRTLAALDYACYLFNTLADAKVDKEYYHAGIDKIEDRKIKLTVDDVNGLLGINISKEDITSILTSLGFKVDSQLEVSVPNRRKDITIKEDLIEEVGRLYGYNLLPSTIPTDCLIGGFNNSQNNERKIKNILSNRGLFEVVTYSLVPKDYNKLFTYNHVLDTDDIELLMPLTEDHSTMRKSLIPSLVDVCKYNCSRKYKNNNIFEVGKVYYKKDNEYIEEYRLAIAMMGSLSSTLWQQKDEQVDFYVIKGIVNQLFEKFGLSLEYIPINKDIKEMHPKRSASLLLDGNDIGFVGQIHPKYAHDNDLDGLYVLEIKIDTLLNYVKPDKKFEQIIKLPSVERDIALVVKKDVTASSIVNVIKKSEKTILSSVNIFDVYTGDKVAEDEKSIAIKLIFSSNEALTDEVINDKIRRILKSLNYQLGAKIRE